MKRQLSLKVVLALFMVIFFNQSNAAIIPTNYLAPADPGNALAYIRVPASTPPSSSATFHTFSVKNNNSYPVSVVDVGCFHTDTLFFGSVPFTANGSSYSVWVKANPGPGAPIPISSLNGWSLVSSFGPVNVVNNGSVSITAGINVIIPPGENYQFAVVSTSDFIARTVIKISPPTIIDYPNPPSFTGGPGNNVVFTTGANLGEQWGQYPNILYNTGTARFHAYEGFINVERSAPQAPAVSANPNPVCEGNTLTLTATPPSYVTTPVITWFDPNGVNIGNGTTLTITNITTAQAGNYSATVSDGTLTSAPAFVNVQVLKTPEPTVSGRTAYCINDQFEAVTTNGQNVKWFTTPSGGIGSIIPPYVNTQMSGSYTFYASQTQSGCESELSEITITVAPKPSAPTVTSPIGVCETSVPDPLTAIGQNLKWYYQPSGGLASLVPPTFSTGKLDTFSFWVSQTVDGCEGPRSRLDAIVTFKPNGLIKTTADSLCQNQELILSYFGSGLPESAYNWGLPTGATLLDGTKEGPLSVRFDSAGYHVVTLQVGNLGCYSDVYKQTIKVNAIPKAFIALDRNICKNESKLIGLFEYSPTIDTFFWDFDGGSVSHYATDQGPYSVSWNTAGTKVVMLTVADKLCRTIKRDTVTVHELPDAKVVVDGLTDNGIVCAGDSLKMSARTIVPTSQYTWTPARFFDNYNTLPVVFGRVDFKSAITLNVTDEYGCKNKDSIIIQTKSCCQITFPTAFTPNGDGKNDMFHALTPGFNDFKTLRIMNRWGQVIFETADARKGWDGLLRGEPQDLGTYFYYLNYMCNGKPTEQRGEFVLIR